MSDMNAIAERRQDEKARRREEIVDAVEALALENGWDQVTVGSVAKQARLSRALVYIYFKGKADLHAALSERARDALFERFKSAVSTNFGIERFRALAHEYIRFAEQCPHYFEAITHFEAATQCCDEDAEAVPSTIANNKVHRLIVRVLEEEIAAGTVRSDLGDLNLVAINLWAFTHGLIQISASRRTWMDSEGICQEALAEQAMSMLSRMLARP